VLHGGSDPPGKGQFCGWQTWACPVVYIGAWIFGSTMRRFIELLRSLVSFRTLIVDEPTEIEEIVENT